MAGIPSPYDWKSLIEPASAFGAKILGDTLAPDPSVQNAKTNAETAQVSNEIAKTKLANSNAVRRTALPGMYTQLGFSPSQGGQMANDYAYGASNPSFALGGSSGDSGGASNAGKIALGAGLTAAPYVPGIIGHAATGTTAASGLGGLGHVGSILGAAAPIAIPAAAVLAGALIWKHTQVHPTADKWVQGAQAPFDQKWQQVQDAQLQGKVSPQQAKQIQATSAQNYLNALNSFASKGNKEMQVARQAAHTFKQFYGDPGQYGVQFSFAV